MRLSEAIRLGAMATPQGFGSNGINGDARCALGAAAFAIGVWVDANWAILRERFPALRVRVSECPGCPIDPRKPYCMPGVDTVGGAIWRLNDSHHWTRERIAAWVATVEPVEAPVQERQPASPASAH